MACVSLFGPVVHCYSLFYTSNAILSNCVDEAQHTVSVYICVGWFESPNQFHLYIFIGMEHTRTRVFFPPPPFRPHEPICLPISTPFHCRASSSTARNQRHIKKINRYISSQYSVFKYCLFSLAPHRTSNLPLISISCVNYVQTNTTTTTTAKRI